MLVYNRKLTDADVLKVEEWLTSLQPAFIPANLQASAHDDFFVLDFFYRQKAEINLKYVIILAFTDACGVLLVCATQETSSPAMVLTLGHLARASSVPSMARPPSMTTDGS